jgi:acetyl-CoA synthetase
MKPFQRIQSLEDYHKVYNSSVENPEAFWAEIARSFVWQKPFTEVLNWDFEGPNVRWFEDGVLNITENCLDRHLQQKGNQTAIVFEPNRPEDDSRSFTYAELHQAVMNFSQVLLNQGVKKGDRVCIYMGMVPELAIAVLACARIGAIHSVVFGGFSAQSISDRLTDANAHFVITQDGAFRGNKVIPLKSVIDEALLQCDFVQKVIVLTHTKTSISMLKERDVWWEVEIEKVGNAHVAPVPMNAEDPLFILYTSGSTGKPKGVVHTCGGYMVWANYTFEQVFQYQEGELHFCTADIGWITGHSYIVYGPLLAGAKTLMFEGIPTFPDHGRFWDIVEKHKVNILYTAPTAIRSLMAFGTDVFQGKDLSSLRVLGTVGEPINEEAWRWYSENVGKNRCPIVDTWWQTETGGIMISNLAGVTADRAAWATLPLPGIQPILVDEHGNENHEINPETGFVHGNLCVKFPWPGMLRTTYGDHARCYTNYFATYKNLYFTGDGAYKDAAGNYRITGRVDDVLNVSGHRIGTAEVENAINQHLGVVESAVVGYPHDIKGQAIYAFVVCSDHTHESEMIRRDINETIAKLIGPIAKADRIQIVRGLPKTRSGKIMRRILRKIAEGELDQLGDTSTLLDPTVVDEICKAYSMLG